MAQQTLIPLSDPAGWRSALRPLPHAFGHTWESCRAFSLSSGYPTYLYSYSSATCRVAVPVAERQFRGAVDVVTPYGVSGFTGIGSATRFAAAWRRFATERGWVCGYFAQHPLIELPSGLEDDSLTVDRRAYVLNLSLDVPELVRRLSQNRRRQLRSWPATAAELTFEREDVLAFILTECAAFYAERNAAEIYAFSEETWSALAEAANTELIGMVQDGRIVAASLFAWQGRLGEYMFNISQPSGRSASVHLIWEAALRMKSKGIAWLNLGGGVRENDGVAGFKQRFGPDIYLLRAVRQIYDNASFRALCSAAGVGSAANGSYFPPYHSRRR